MAASPTDMPAPWEPVITRPDPMTAEEWQACLEHDLAEDLDPDELQWEDDFLNPDADLTEAELAEIAEAMDAQSADAPGAAGVTAGADPAGAGADPAGVAQVLAAQAAAASARRRGPGQPGSARPLAGEPASAAAGFGTGRLLDVMPVGPDLAVLAGAASFRTNAQPRRAAGAAPPVANRAARTRTTMAARPASAGDATQRTGAAFP